MSSSESICLFQRNAGMSEVECVYFCHMNYTSSVFIQLMVLYMSCAERGNTHEVVDGRLK